MSWQKSLLVEHALTVLSSQGEVCRWWEMVWTAHNYACVTVNYRV